ncbi:hypothetical protein Pen02_29490 [Plantactinospora endophytica]|uniref:Uncharacterized protein n=1 Tax=Plantactinospora endophytica TaxID=673535 RepID=A0ABQ4DZW2_9ACTN|nr:hypothetical protein Pen02_29490 [Plantactinospora endophytica]
MDAPRYDAFRGWAPHDRLRRKVLPDKRGTYGSAQQPQNATCVRERLREQFEMGSPAFAERRWRWRGHPSPVGASRVYPPVSLDAPTHEPSDILSGHSEPIRGRLLPDAHCRVEADGLRRPRPSPAPP